MKLVLCSEGFYTPNTVQACVELCNKPQDEISVAVINEGFAVEEGDKYWVLDNLNDVAKNFPGGMDIVNLLALPLNTIERRVMQRDVICVIGGHTDYLMHVFNESGFSTLLAKLLETKVYVGSSAGSMVIGKRVSSEAYAEIYGEPGDWEVDEYLNLVDFALKPHLNSQNFPKNREEILLKVTQNYKGTVYGLADDSAVVINGDEIKLIGSEPVVINDGKLAT